MTDDAAVADSPVRADGSTSRRVGRSAARATSSSGGRRPDEVEPLVVSPAALAAVREAPASRIRRRLHDAQPLVRRMEELVDDRVADRVTRAIASIPVGDPTTEQAVMNALVAEWRSAEALIEPSKEPEFARALLEAVRKRQSPSWVEATTPKEPNPNTALPGKPEDWTIRHYTNKALLTLGPPDTANNRRIVKIGAPPFDELLSSVTISAMTRAKAFPKLESDERLHTNTSSKTSGHTSGLDWTNIGNVGDTFYALFYKRSSATGVVPAFINDALYYAEWPIADFGDGWASSDWLATAADSQKSGGGAKRPRGSAVEGEISRVIAHQLGTIGLQASRMDADATARHAKSELGGFENFEVKKHGSMKLGHGGWAVANPDKIAAIGSGVYDAKDEWRSGA